MRSCPLPAATSCPCRSPPLDRTLSPTPPPAPSPRRIPRPQPRASGAGYSTPPRWPLTLSPPPNETSLSRVTVTFALVNPRAGDEPSAAGEGRGAALPARTLSRGTGRGVGPWGAWKRPLQRPRQSPSRLHETLGHGERALRLDLRPSTIFSMKISQFRILGVPRAPADCRSKTHQGGVREGASETSPGRGGGGAEARSSGDRRPPGQLGAWRDENSLTGKTGAKGLRTLGPPSPP